MNHAVGSRALAGKAVHLVLITLVVVMTLVWERRWRQQLHLLRSREQREHDLVRKAFHDSLTNLPNRSLLHDRFRQAVMRAQREGRTVALLFVDLDGFKSINDQYGHSVGDRVLTSVAERLSESLRASDTIARLGGDEFIVLLEDLRTGDVVQDVAERLRGSFASSMRVGDDNIEIGLSIGGVVTWPLESDLDELIRQADVALYEAKRTGKLHIIELEAQPV